MLTPKKNSGLARRCLACVVAILGLGAAVFPEPGRAQAGSSAEALSRNDAVRLFLEQNPGIEAARLEVERARADQIEADLRPNPQVTVTAENFRVSGDSRFSRIYEWSASYAETVERGGKRRLRATVADLTVGLAQARLDATIREGIYQVERHYLEAVRSRRRLDTALEAQAAITQLLGYNEARFEEGAVSEGDLIRTRLEAIQVDASVRNARLALRQATIRLTELLREVDFERWEVDGDFDAARELPSLEALRRLALIERPDLRAARVETDRSGQRIELERAGAVADIHPFVGYKRVSSSNTLLFGLSVPLRLRDRNQDGIARAIADQRITESRVEGVRIRVLAEVEAAYRAWESAAARVSRFEEDFLLAADRAREIAFVSYDEGVAELISLLDAERIRADVRAGYFDAQFDYSVSILEIERAIGRSIEP